MRRAACVVEVGIDRLAQQRVPVPEPSVRALEQAAVRGADHRSRARPRRPARSGRDRARRPLELRRPARLRIEAGDARAPSPAVRPAGARSRGRSPTRAAGSLRRPRSRQAEVRPVPRCPVGAAARVQLARRGAGRRGCPKSVSTASRRGFGRRVSTSSTGSSSMRLARYPASSSVGASARWTSSSNRTSGRVRVACSASSTAASNRRAGQLGGHVRRRLAPSEPARQRRRKARELLRPLAVGRRRVQPARQPRQQLRPRPERGRAAAQVQRRRAPGVRGPSDRQQLLRQPRLAHPRLPGDENDRPGTAADPIPHACERRPLRTAADERALAAIEHGHAECLRPGGRAGHRRPQRRRRPPPRRHRARPLGASRCRRPARRHRAAPRRSRPRWPC